MTSFAKALAPFACHGFSAVAHIALLGVASLVTPKMTHDDAALEASLVYASEMFAASPVDSEMAVDNMGESARKPHGEPLAEATRADERAAFGPPAPREEPLLDPEMTEPIKGHSAAGPAWIQVEGMRVPGGFTWYGPGMSSGGQAQRSDALFAPALKREAHTVAKKGEREEATPLGGKVKDKPARVCPPSERGKTASLCRRAMSSGRR
jgi:hypothetical protein